MTRKVNLASIDCTPRLSVYELPGQAVSRVAMFSSASEVTAVVYPDTNMLQIFTTDGTDDIVVERSSEIDVAAPWVAPTTT